MGMSLSTVRKRLTSYPDQSVLKKIEDYKEYYFDRGYNIAFNKPFNLVIWLKQTFVFGEVYDILQNPPDDEDEDEEDMVRVNTEKSFKLNECVICLKPPNVLFCNCGHIPICEECDKTKSLNACPVCRTENTIKRTI